MIRGIVDLHVHSAPSILPRRYTDPQFLAKAQEVGVAIIVLKAHEGSTAERAQLAGAGAVGGIVLNSPVGGANADAVEVNARLGGRVVWMPTVSATAHIAARDDALKVHANTSFRAVPVIEDRRLRPEWFTVLEVVSRYNMLLASGHMTAPEALVLFRAAYALGVRRFLLNHPSFAYQKWSRELAPAFKELGATIEIGVLADLLSSGQEHPSTGFLRCYPVELLAFGSDLGHADFVDYQEGIREWQGRMLALTGEAQLERILCINGRELLGL